jgi:tetratricopeptide (TPR) repeat protein
VRANPRVTDYRDGLARCLLHLGLLRRDAGDPEGAMELYREIIAHREEIARHQPDWGANTLMLGLASCSVGQIHHDLGRADEAKACFDEAIRIFGAALESSPDDPPILEEQIHLLASCVEVRCRDPGRAVGLAERFVRLFPQSGAAWLSLALARYRVGDWPAADEALEKRPA